MEQYLSNVQKIYMHLADSNHPLTKLNLGQKISGVVKRVQKQGGCSLLLNNQIQGIVAPQHCTSEHKTNKKIGRRYELFYVDFQMTSSKERR